MTMAIIYTNRGVQILVDDEDFDDLSKFSWHISNRGYAARSIRRNGKNGSIRMHRYLLGLESGDERYGDHINGDQLDNRRFNLRIVTPAQNMMNTRKPRNNTSGFKGVCRTSKRPIKWAAQIRLKGRNIALGVYETPELAHEVYCLAADMIFGEFANHG